MGPSPEGKAEGVKFTNAGGHVVTEATFMRWADDRIISIHDQPTRTWPQLGDRDITEAVALILDELSTPR